MYLFTQWTISIYFQPLINATRMELMITLQLFDHTPINKRYQADRATVRITTTGSVS